MPARSLTRETCEQAWRLVEKYGSVWKAAAEVGVPDSTLSRQYLRAVRQYGMPDIGHVSRPGDRLAAAIQSANETIEDRREIRDAAWWKREAEANRKRLLDAEHVAEQLAGVRDQKITIPDWLLPTPSKGEHRAVLGMLLSDIHAGEVVEADEIIGINRFNAKICRERLRRYFAAACEIGPRWIVDCQAIGAVLFLGGDLIAGDIHEELRITNELTAHDQVRLVVEEVSAGIEHLLKVYDLVHVVSVPGNHGRTTMKPTAKRYSALSYDTLAASMIADRYEGSNTVTFQVGAAPDALVPVLGWSVFLTHGDKMGTGGGQGFIGPIAPIVRGTKKVEAQQARVNRRPDIILHGHFHTSANPGIVLSNGSVPGYTEYGNGLRASVEPPQQWLFLIHEKWCLRERVEVRLEDPRKPEKPRVRIPARMAS